MPLDRRQFLVASGALLPTALLGAQSAATALERLAPAPAAGGASVPWHQRLRRVGQVNFNERDPVELDITQWADYWQSVAVDAVLLSVTGIIAFYPTQVPFHRRSRFLGDRDFYGECVAALRKRGIRVVARLSPDLQWEDTAQEHPEWFVRDAQGGFQRNTDVPQLLRTCMFSTYYTEHTPAIMREVQARYDVDALYTNGWPPLGGLPACHCDVCRRLAPPGTPAHWEQFTDRTIELWKLYSGIAREKRPDGIFVGNLGGGVRAMPNLAKIAPLVPWFNADNQGRGGDASPIWGAALQGRAAHAVMQGRTVTNVVGAYATGGGVRWRNASKSREEAEMWMDEIAASGMTIWYHWLGGQTGLGEDHRWQETGRRYLQWHARHEEHFVTRRRTLANVGVVMGQRTHLFHQPPGEGRMQEFVDGLYAALLEHRCCFDFVHEDELTPDKLKKYSALLLPNIAWLSDAQCAQLRDYVAAGGSLLASFETAMFDENGRRRPNSGLADLFGLESVGAPAGPNGNGFYARIEPSQKAHELLRGFADTNLLPGGGWRLPIQSQRANEALLAAVPAYAAYPPEMVYDPGQRTDGPALIARETGASRLVYFAGDIERSAWRTGDTDLSRLLRNAVAWLTRGRTPVSVEGPGLIECFAWETGPGFALHLLNYTNPAAHRGWIREFVPIGEQRVRFELPPGRTITRVELLRSERNVPFQQTGNLVEFAIPQVVDYEVAALHA